MQLQYKIALLRAIPTNGIWLSCVGGVGGGVIGHWSDMGIWQSGIGGVGGVSGDIGATWGFGCRVEEMGGVMGHWSDLGIWLYWWG